MITALLFLVAALVRLALNNVNGFSGADETVMLRMSSQAAYPDYNYRVACERWYQTPEAWKYPGVVRYGNILLIALLMRLVGKVTFRIPTSVSTVASIATVALTWAIARKLAPGSETIATILVAGSPLQLHLGRRALQDSLVSALTLGGFAAGIYGYPILAVLALAALLSVKETALMAWPALFGAFWLAGVSLVSNLAVLAAAPWLFFFGFCALSREPRVFFRFFRSVNAARDDAYGRKQEGAPHRLAVDLLLTAPLVFLASARSNMTPAVLFILLQLAAHSIVPIMRSVRMVLASEAMLRVVAAAVIAKWDPFLAVMLLAVNAYAEYLLFRKVFLIEKIYDPVTAHLTQALGMSPKPAT